MEEKTNEFIRDVTSVYHISEHEVRRRLQELLDMAVKEAENKPDPETEGDISFLLRSH